jgi:hypothetical protein
MNKMNDYAVQGEFMTYIVRAENEDDAVRAFDARCIGLRGGKDAVIKISSLNEYVEAELNALKKR